MTRLAYTDDEVLYFHPAFEEAANEALRQEGLADAWEWVHHLRTPGGTLRPDYVLQGRDNHRWRLAVEIKRRPTSVYSSRNQLQAKGYAEEYADQYAPDSPRYFALTNLEVAILFALRGQLPPGQCRLQDGVYEAGSLAATPEAAFKARLVEQLRRVCRRVLQPGPPVFDEVWPGILQNLMAKADLLTGAVPPREPDSPGWPLVRDYFCHAPALDAARIFLLRCLLAEYLRGVLSRYRHPQADRLLPLGVSPDAKVGPDVARALERVRQIDFEQLFEEEGLEVYRALPPGPAREQLGQYVRDITTPPARIEEFARTRLDRDELLDGLLSATHPGEELDNRGKVATDPELAALLAGLVLRGEGGAVLDPCCGDGALLEAAYERLRFLGTSHEDVLAGLHGLEVDPVLTRLAALRLLLREPAAVRAGAAVDVRQADLFADPAAVAAADVILMNPPFKRYEAQDERPVSPELKAYYAAQIEKLTGTPAVAATGQQNLYVYYVEYVLAAARPGCRLGVILDNKWYHNIYGVPLKRLLLEKTAIEALVEYPYSGLFADWTIATSILVCRKVDQVPADQQTKFIRCLAALDQVDPAQVGRAFDGGEEWPALWTCREVPQKDLDASGGWKSHFRPRLARDYQPDLVALPSLFEHVRRGSLAKEEGGMGALAFPFSRRTFGHKRSADPQATRRYENLRGAALSREENQRLAALAARVPTPFRGYAINNPDVLVHYELTETDVLAQPTLEPSALRRQQDFIADRRAPWTARHEAAVAQMLAEPAVRDFIAAFRELTGLDEELMPNEHLFVGLREPFAGELIVPRKLRRGHRVHINPFAFAPAGRQVRLSSNFLSYSGCKAFDAASGLDRAGAVRLIAAFLLSSFGQLQFEMKGYNREGLLSVEEEHLAEVVVPDPRDIPAENRRVILDAFSRLPFPVPTDRRSDSQPERNALDRAFAVVLCARHADWTEDGLLAEVHRTLDDYLAARRP
jgi:hypothetical protein